MDEYCHHVNEVYAVAVQPRHRPFIGCKIDNGLSHMLVHVLCRLLGVLMKLFLEKELNCYANNDTRNIGATDKVIFED